MSWTETDYPFGNPVAYVASGGSGGSPYQKTLLTGAVATPCLGPTALAAQFIVGVVNNSLLAQTVTVLLYDSVLTATGTPVASISALGAGQVVTFPAPGLPVAAGCVALASGAPNTPGIQILCR